MYRFHAWQSALLFTAIMLFHLLFSWSSFLSWIFFLGDLALMGFLAFKAYQDAEILERYKQKQNKINIHTEAPIIYDKKMGSTSSKAN